MIEDILRKIAIFSERRPFLMVAIILTITILAGIEATNVKFQTAFEKMLPQDNPVIKTLYEVRDNFGGTDLISICIKLKPSDNLDKVNDIRDPRVLKYIKILEADLKGIDGITDVNSPVDVIIKRNNGTVPNDIETVKEIYNSLPEDVKRKIFNYDYSMVVVNVYTDAGGDQKKLMEILEEMERRVEDSPVPPGVEVVFTGTPPMRRLMSVLMKKSQIVTTLVGGIGVLLVLFLYFRKPLSTIMPLIPIVIAVIWTGGAMGILGIPVDMATAGIGSLLLGIGIDYAIHLMHRYMEERKKGKDVAEAIETAVVSTGMALIATTATTVVGFLALVIAPLPMMANLGKVCALGIAFCMICVLTLLPALLVIEEKYILPLLKGEGSR
ncbi:MAG TPA: RND family transporter [Methanothermococcus okinawensis]|uniref:RND family transporter n=1 Tax=Methanothermococcus okinawensis TaxID=155863 RepID=A0A832ZBN9_9EURY|nr:RND family transporter [Methanothermococcus okinawensis]